jgi:hypothetical protein
MMLKEMIAVYCECHTIINTLRENKAEFLDAKSRLFQSNICALKRSRKIKPYRDAVFAHFMSRGCFVGRDAILSDRQSMASALSHIVSYTQYDLVQKPSTLDALTRYFTPSLVKHQRLSLQFLSNPEDGRK